MTKHKNLIKYGAISAFFAVFIAILGLTNPTTTFAQGASTTPTSGTSTGSTNVNNTQSDDITCAIEKMGWILCPIIETSGKIGDQAFNFLSKTFLETEPELISNSSSGTKAAWEIARNLANIMFIIAFLIIILSQVTGRGLNNYGVKKMLPRLVIAAIAVNVSYYICQLIVDLTNILGFEIQRFMVNQAAAVSDKAAMPVQTGLIDNQTSGGTLGGIASGVLGLPLVVWFLMPMLFLGIGTVVITCIVIVIILLLRKAFIVLLVVVSPIAFVAYILPNTEKFFQKWGRMFWQLLLVFPIVSLLFGGGQLASAIVLVAGSSSDTYKDAQSNNGGKCIQLPRSTTIDNSGNSSGSGGGVGWWGTTSTSNKTTAKNVAEVKTCAAGSTPFLLGLVAAGIAVAPMIAVWAVLKGALSAAGAIGGKISGAVQNAGNKAGKYASVPEDKLKKRVSENLNSRWQNIQSRGIATDNLAGRYAKRKAMRERRLALAKSDLERNQAHAMDSILGNQKTAGALTSGLSVDGAARATRAAEAAEDKHAIEEMQAASLITRNQNDSELHTTVDRFVAGQLTMDSPELAAAIDELGKRQDFRQLERLVNSIGRSGKSSLSSRVLSQVISQNAGGMFSGGEAAAIARGALQNDYSSTVATNLKNGMAPEKLASFNGSLTSEASYVIRRSAQSPDLSTRTLAQEAAAGLSKSAGELVNDPVLNKRVSGGVLEKMQGFKRGQF